ncbi:MAG: hypothetical protein ACFB10_23645 [Salibacteraceae bacterium]
MKILLAIVALASLTISFKEAKRAQSNANEIYFKVEVMQDGEVVKEKNDIITLEKKPFKFKLTYFKTKDIFVSASWGTYYYDYPDEKNIFECNDNSFFKDCRFVSIKTGNEEKFNANKDIYVGDDSYQNVWFYDESIDWYRMDEGVTVKNGVIHAEVTVENIYDMDKRDERKFQESEYNYKIGKIDQDIYMVFATEHYENGMEHPIELQREKFTLMFK